LRAAFLAGAFFAAAFLAGAFFAAAFLAGAFFAAGFLAGAFFFAAAFLAGAFFAAAFLAGAFFFAAAFLAGAFFAAAFLAGAFFFAAAFLAGAFFAAAFLAGAFFFAAAFLAGAFFAAAFLAGAFFFATAFFAPDLRAAMVGFSFGVVRGPDFDPRKFALQVALAQQFHLGQGDILLCWEATIPYVGSPIEGSPAAIHSPSRRGGTGLNAPRTAEEILTLLRSTGAPGLASVALRENRSTLWSLTQRGTVLNLHVAYAHAPAAVLLSFAALIRGAGRRSDEYRAARKRVAAWDGLQDHLARIHRNSVGSSRRPGPCCATPLQRVYLQRLYRYLNATRFLRRLPATVPIRLSNRFTSRLGQMVAGTAEGRRAVVEIALHVDLMLAANDAVRVDTLLHEMAHVANYLFDGEVGHRRRWREWARSVGCNERATCAAPIQARDHRRALPARVPQLPAGWRRWASPAVLMDPLGPSASSSDS